MQETLLTILGSVVALGATFLALIKSGHIRIGKENGISAKLDELGSNHLHSIAETLLRIERKLEKLDEISEGIVYLKARQNGT